MLIVNRNATSRQQSMWFCICTIILHTVKRLWKSLVLFVLSSSFLWLCYLMFTTPIDENPRDNFDDISANVEEIEIQTKIYPNYYEDDLHPIWMFKISKTYDESLLRRWTEPNPTNYKSDKWTQGENGNAFKPSNEKEQQIMDKLQDRHKYNILASESISLHRSAPDYRFDECKQLSYPEKLPTVSVIIVFHNEAWSTLLRTVWSVIDRSPRELLQEIILVDDDSTWAVLKRPLDDYIEFLPVNVRLIRTKKREGLIRARLVGAKNATGSVLTFLDAHVECSSGWLEPLLSRIASDRSVVAVPFIGTITASDMSYHGASLMQIIGLRWHLLFYWMRVPNRERLRTKYDSTAPIRSPSHVGCAFAVDREFFFEIGSYDEQMEIWGSENVELAFRVWMCGGSLESLPCSRVGHLYRKSTYSFLGDSEYIKERNNVRLIEVWMDEFKNYYYAANPVAKKISPGDLTERKELRKRLKCKSFRWYLEHIFPESTLLKEYTMMGEFISVSSGLCLDGTESAKFAKIIPYKCQGLAGNQFFALATSGQIVHVEEWCVGVRNKTMVFVPCVDQDKSQLWHYDSGNQWIVHKESQLCVQDNKQTAVLSECDLSDNRIQWEYRPTWDSNVTNETQFSFE